MSASKLEAALIQAGVDLGTEAPPHPTELSEAVMSRVAGGGGMETHDQFYQSIPGEDAFWKSIVRKWPEIPAQ